MSMSLRPPTAPDLRELGDRLHLDLTDDEIDLFRDVAQDRLSSYKTVREFNPPSRLGGHNIRERSGGRRPTAGNNQYNAWITRCEVRGADTGKLEGWNVAIKDNVAVAGVEMTCGSAVVEGYTSDVDATIVTRLLDEGARIVGKTNMDDMAMSISGHSAFGPITHPIDGHLAGGSSGGSAVVVATGEVDAAIGTDQGGSIRIPAAYCGIVGLKPTYGLVPYTGCIGLSPLVDHPGPMAKNVETVAKMLTVIAGETDLDPRQPMKVPTEQYEDNVDGEIDGLSIGILTEGFNNNAGDPEVLNHVLNTVRDLESHGATVESISIPLHAESSAIHSVLSSEELVAALFGEGLGHDIKGWYNTSWVDSFGKFRRAQGRDFPARFKMALLMGAYTSDRYHSRFYARAMNLVLELRDQYNQVLNDCDILAMPTVSNTAPGHDPDQDEFDRLKKSSSAGGNTAAFNRTGHPAISVPGGTVDDLPVGIMFVGKQFDDSTVLNAASAIEKSCSNDD